MLEACNISYKNIIHNVSTLLVKEELTVLIGSNGAGKTTLLRLLAGGLTPTKGEVFFDNIPLRNWDKRKLARHRAVLPQEKQLAFDFMAQDVVALGRTPHGPYEESLIHSVMASVAIESLWGRKYMSLSGGEKQLIHFARVLAQLEGSGRPKVLLLDEPTANLDIRYQEVIINAIQAQARRGTLILMVLHDLDLARRCADRVIMLSKGSIVAQGTTEEVLGGGRSAALRAGFSTDTY